MRNKLLQLLYVVSASGILLFAAGGCFWGLNQQPYTAVKYYDLAIPPQITLDKMQVKFIPFESTEPANYKMVYRNADCQIVIDDYNKWIQPPPLMLTRYLQGAFKQSGITSESCELIISGNIFMFRIDLQKNTVSLGVSYSIKSSVCDTEKLLFQNSTTFSHKFKKQGPQYFVEAMSKCANDMVLTIKKNIKEIEKNKTSDKK